MASRLRDFDPAGIHIATEGPMGAATQQFLQHLHPVWPAMSDKFEHTAIA
jgi:hypothetical protein